MGITKYAHATRAMHRKYAKCIYIYIYTPMPPCIKAMLSFVLRGEREIDHLKLGASDVVKRSIYFPKYYFSVKLRTAFHGEVQESLKVRRPSISVRRCCGRRGKAKTIGEGKAF